MADLRNIMYEAVSDIAEPEESVLRTDLARGRQALARRRSTRTRRQFLVPVGIAAAAAGVLGLSVLGNGLGSGATPRDGISAGRDGSARIALISYTGRQAEGFTIDQVPDGWEIQGNTSYAVIAPVGFADQDVQELTGKIELHVAGKGELAVERAEARPLPVGGVTATRFTFPDPDMTVNTTDKPKVGPNSSAGLLLPAGKKTVLIQFTNAHDWDDATIVKFAAGVHLNNAR